MEITCTAEKNLTAEFAEEILHLQQTAFPRTEAFKTRRWWQVPVGDDDLWFTARDDDGRLIGNVLVSHRRMGTSAGDLEIAGIGNVCSHPDARGKGAARACMEAVDEYIANGGRVDFGLLLTGPSIERFYTKLGWRNVDNLVIMTDAEGNRSVFDPERNGHRMVYPGRRTMNDWPEGDIDLNGLLW